MVSATHCQNIYTYITFLNFDMYIYTDGSPQWRGLELYASTIDLVLPTGFLPKACAPPFRNPATPSDICTHALPWAVGKASAVWLSSGWAAKDQNYQNAAREEGETAGAADEYDEENDEDDVWG